MKLAIIGAGPGGLYAALAAAGKDIQADLFEKGKSERELSAANVFLIHWGLWPDRATGCCIPSMSLY